jgi:hypothetical protein
MINEKKANEVKEEASYNNNSNSVISETVANRNLLPIETIEEENDESSFSSVINNNNLLYEEKDISFFKLYIHLSEK